VSRKENKNERERIRFNQQWKKEKREFGEERDSAKRKKCCDFEQYSKEEKRENGIERFGQHLFYQRRKVHNNAQSSNVVSVSKGQNEREKMVFGSNKMRLKTKSKFAPKAQYTFGQGGEFLERKKN